MFPAVIEAAERDFEQYGLRVAQTSVDRSERSFSARIGVEGPLFTGDERSLSYVRVEANLQSSVEEVSIERYTPPFRDIPAFDLPVLSEREILAEKVRALLTRRQPRDLYDIYHLIDRSVEIDPRLAQSKLEYYDLTYDEVTLLERARSFESEWALLEPLVYSRLPAFDSVIEKLDSAVAE